MWGGEGDSSGASGKPRHGGSDARLFTLPANCCCHAEGCCCCGGCSSLLGGFPRAWLSPPLPPPPPRPLSPHPSLLSPLSFPSAASSFPLAPLSLGSSAPVPTTRRPPRPSLPPPPPGGGFPPPPPSGPPLRGSLRGLLQPPGPLLAPTGRTRGRAALGSPPPTCPEALPGPGPGRSRPALGCRPWAATSRVPRGDRDLLGHGVPSQTPIQLQSRAGRAGSGSPRGLPLPYSCVCRGAAANPLPLRLSPQVSAAPSRPRNHREQREQRGRGQVRAAPQRGHPPGETGTPSGLTGAPRGTGAPPLKLGALSRPLRSPLTPAEAPSARPGAPSPFPRLCAGEAQGKQKPTALGLPQNAPVPSWECLPSREGREEGSWEALGGIASSTSPLLHPFALPLPG